MAKIFWPVLSIINPAKLGLDNFSQFCLGNLTFPQLNETIYYNDGED
jgi:hypothetical protein